jgi:hypothetical protein
MEQSVRREPSEEYLRRRSQRQSDAERLEGRHRLLGYFRLAILVAGAVLAWMILRGDALPGAILLVPVALFFALSRVHDGVLSRMEDLRRAAAYYGQGIDRMAGRWAGTGEGGGAFVQPSHPYAADLDLFGPGSLFELLCSARTHAGQETLARWLLEPAGPEEIRLRQEAVDELRGRLDLREDLALLSAGAREGVDSEPLARWAARPPLLLPGRARALLPILAATSAITLSGWAFAGWSIIPAAVMLAAQSAVAASWRLRVMEVVTSVERAARDLQILSQVLARLERESFSSRLLAGLHDALRTGGAPPSKRIARLGRLVELLDSRRNQVFALIAPVLLWATQLAFALEAWRSRHGSAVEGWLHAVGEIEALSSLAGYAFEHPGDPFPDVVDHGPLFEAVALGHPLIPEAGCVRNDLRLGSDLRLLVVSGSNMSGKSTLLRSIGINAVLAQAGAPVRAVSLRLSPLHLGASIRNVDSLQDGKSRFYAEITRLKQILEISSDHHVVLYLLDELLSGTNSHDRRIGAEAVVRGLVRRGAVGLLTTHDLALSRIAEEMGSEALNVHFEDHVESGEITFDYLLKPGVVAKGNALELMRAVGIEV